MLEWTMNCHIYFNPKRESDGGGPSVWQAPLRRLSSSSGENRSGAEHDPVWTVLAGRNRKRAFCWNTAREKEGSRKNNRGICSELGERFYRQWIRSQERLFRSGKNVVTSEVNSYSVAGEQKQCQRWPCFFCSEIPNREAGENVFGALFSLFPLDSVACLREGKDRLFQILLVHHYIIGIMSGYWK